jgi:acetolactate synthase-1/2/3 large subunit
MTCLRSGAACRGKCGEVECPTYTPDFVKLAESYGAKGIRVTKKEDIIPAFEEARKSTKVPTIIEFEINPEDLVYPMIRPGGTLRDMILDC